MGGHNDSGPLAVELVEQVHQIPDIVVIQVGSQLVQEQDGGAADQGPCKLHPPALPDGELRRIAVLHIRHPHDAQGLGHSLLGLAAHPHGGGGQQEVVPDGPLADEQALLVDDAEGAGHPGPPGAHHAGHVEVVDVDRAPVRGDLSAHQLQEGALARSAAADEKHKFALLHRNGEIPQGVVHLPVLFIQF